jgi:chorismate dehydratase
MQSGVNDYSDYAAVLLIGDEALRRNKIGLDGFELVFDLALEWYNWQKLPFVFAVWAMRSTLPEERKADLRQSVENSLAYSENHLDEIGQTQGRQLGLDPDEIREYLEGFNYRLGERERESMRVFEELLAETETIAIRKG